MHTHKQISVYKCTYLHTKVRRMESHIPIKYLAQFQQRWNNNQGHYTLSNNKKEKK